jgi:hypothetical protein
MAPIALAAITVGCLGAWMAMSPRTRPAAGGSAAHFSVGVPSVALSGARVSPDGRTLARVGVGHDGKSGVWLRNLDERDAEAVDGLDDVGGGFEAVIWSPDGTKFAVKTARGLMSGSADGDIVRPASRGRARPVRRRADNAHRPGTSPAVSSNTLCILKRPPRAAP